MEAVFEAFNERLEVEGKVREEIRAVVREVELVVRKAQSTLQTVHNTAHAVPTCDIVARVKAFYVPLREHYAQLRTLFKAEEYYRYNDHWRNVTQSVVQLMAFAYWLESGHLITLPEVEGLMGVTEETRVLFHLDLEDYLVGLCGMCNEMSRFCVNLVTAGDYQAPRRILAFVGDVYSGFRLLNLKNDFLRKRFDSVKYDMKKIEEIVYDISIRGLGSKTDE